MRSINKQEKKPGYIFSVFQNDKTTDENMVNHDNVLKNLVLKGVTFKPIQGQYKHDNGEVSNELGYFVESNTAVNDHELFELVKELCLVHNQESFLNIDTERNARLIYNNGKARSIGVFTCVNESEALASEAFTYCPKTNYYFICK
jgi:hypothetical protein